MKTTIEVKGFEIVIDETEDNLIVTATKDGETVEEFEISLSEDVDSDSEEEVQDFEEFEEEDEMESEEEEEDEMESEEEFEEEDEMESEEDEVKLESFQSFINKKRK
jgi:hypothetical protein